MPFENAPLLVQQWAGVSHAPSVGAIRSVECTNLDAVRGSGCDTTHPCPSRLFNIIRMNKFRPAVAHDFFGRETSEIEQSRITVVDRPFRCSAPKHLRNGFSHLA